MDASLERHDSADQWGPRRLRYESLAVVRSGGHVQIRAECRMQNAE